MPKAWVSGQERNEVVVGDLLNLIGVVEIYHGPDQLNIAVAASKAGGQFRCWAGKLPNTAAWQRLASCAVVSCYPLGSRLSIMKGSSPPLMNPDRNSERGSSCFGYATHGHGWI